MTDREQTAFHASFSDMRTADGKVLQVSRGVIKIGDRELKGDNLACLFLRPTKNLTRVSWRS